ncbi:unnamed protein product [Effrenium voratum]|uniref:Uncharacterized protein n=1 Tax=Effrenium voratum TaxID=2562239 RepID=A0AA36HR13_9DINO|nr:unnamed protein product [Effrenium voratum]CAJ1372693.1 unnamed protein product [Effrenium voratum]
MSAPDEDKHKVLKDLAQARLRSFQLENQLLSTFFSETEDLKKAKEELSAAGQRLAELEGELEERRLAEEELKAEVARLKSLKLKVEPACGKPPCFRTASEEIQGDPSSGYLRAAAETVLVATHLVDTYYYGYALNQPESTGWFLCSQTRDFVRAEFGV